MINSKIEFINNSAIKIDRDNISSKEIIERAGRVCYKSESNITPESSHKFVQSLFKNKHLSVFEHAITYMVIEYDDISESEVILSLLNIIRSIAGDASGTIRETTNSIGNHKRCIISTNFRTLLEIGDICNSMDIISLEEINGLSVIRQWNTILHSYIYDESYDSNTVPTIKLSRDGIIISVHVNYNTVSELTPALTEDELYIHHFSTYIVTCDRGVGNELVRHRPPAFSQESTRYVNYKNKGIAYITPSTEFDDDTWDLMVKHMENSSNLYNKILERGYTPQSARCVLPLALKTEIVITANDKEWKHIRNLRYNGTTGTPHPDMKQLMSTIFEWKDNQ